MAFDGTYTNTQPMMTHSPLVIVKVEDDSTNPDTVQYIGKSPHGKGTDENCWMIKRVTTTSSGTTIELASTDFDKIWDDRESYTYS